MRMVPRHPSERPVRARVVKSGVYTRVPYSEPLTPGLRRSDTVSAIGFVTEFSSDERRED